MSKRPYLIYVTFFVACLFINYSVLAKKGNSNAMTAKIRAFFKELVYRNFLKDNFFEVVEGEFYRSSQMPPKNLEKYIKEYGIKTIINLSGEEPFYWVSQGEKQLAEKYGIVVYNFKTNGLYVTGLEEVRTLLTIFYTAPLPILVHCFAGADRTGETAALYLLAVGQDSSDALEQLSAKFGHTRWLFPCKSYLIENMSTIYPGLIESIKRLCNKRFSYEELKDVPACELFEKVLEKRVACKKKSVFFEEFLYSFDDDTYGENFRDLEELVSDF